MNHVALLRLPWPDRALWQNARPHHFARARAVKAYRKEAWARAMEQGVRRIASKNPRLVFSFHPPDRRRRDLQNMPATMKAAIDGIADAMSLDDSKFRCVWPEEWGEPVPGGCVMVECRDAGVQTIELRGVIR